MDTAMSQAPASIDIDSLVRPDRVHRSVYTDQAVFDIEMRRIWDRAWIYVGHESQVPASGDFVTTRLGRQPVVMVRGDDGAIRLLHNRCAHRGTLVVLEERGNAQKFTCSYHNWTYRRDGTLMAVPLADGYGAAFNRDDPCRGMTQVPCVEAYRGFVFARSCADGPSLAEFLGPMASSFDDMVDRAPEGMVEVDGGVLKHSFAGNWKLYLENLNDVLHPVTIHESAVSAATEQSDTVHSDGAGELGVRQMRQNKLSYAFWDRNVGVRAYPYGHSYMAGFHDDDRLIASLDSPVFREYRGKLEAKHGAGRTDEILRNSRFNSNIYPSCSFMSEFRQMRVIHPVSPARTIVHTYSFRLVGAPESMFLDTIRYANIVNSAASPVLTDDLEIYERIGRGLAGDAPAWLDMGRGHGTDEAVANGATHTVRGGSELHLRNMFAAWRSYMTNAKDFPES